MKKKILIGIIVPIIIIVALFTAVFHKTSQSAAKNSEAVYYQQNGITFGTEGGFYHENNQGFLYFYDYQAGQDVIVCNKPNCRHEEWSEEGLSDEERCNAYMGGTINAGFADGERLYMISVSPIEQQAKIIRSDLDRSRQELVAEFSMSFINTFVYKEEVLYIAAVAAETKEDDSGEMRDAIENSSWLMMVDLTSGKVTELSEKRKENNASFTIVGVNEEEILCCYTYLENEFDGTNFDEAQERIEWSSYEFNSGQYQDRRLDDFMITKPYLNEHKLSGCHGVQWMPEGGFEQYQLIVGDITSDKGQTVATLQDEPKYGDGKWFYEQEGKLYYYDVKEDREQELPENLMKNFYLHSETQDYFFGYRSDEASGEGKPCLILKDDLYQGNEEFIELSS